MPEEITSTSPEFERVRDTFREYLQYNRRDTEELALTSARKMAGGVQDHGYGSVEGLYQVTAALAPTESQIAQDVRAQGWKIPAFFKDGRIGRGVARMWGDFALSQKEGRRRGRPNKGAVADRSGFLARKPTLAQMQAFVIALRLRATLYLASGWLGAIEDLGGIIPSGDARRGAGNKSGVDHERGGAIIRNSPGLFEVEFWNRTPGIAQMDAKAGIVRTAAANMVADMRVYIARKAEEDRAWLKERGAAA